MKKKILVVGGGSIGKRHMRNMIAMSIPKELIHCVDPRLDRRQELESYGVKNVYNSLEDSLINNTYDISIICSPTVYHIDQAILLAKKKVNLFIEKPLSSDLSRIDELFDIVSSNQIKVGIAYVFRFSPLVDKVKQLLYNKEIGNILYFRGEFSEYLPDFHPYEDYRSFYMAKKDLGGGSILDQSHIMDLIYYLLGDFKSVSAINRKVSNLEIDTDDLSEMIVELKSDIIGTIHTDILGRNHKKLLEIRGEEGNIYIDFYRNSVQVYKTEDKSMVTFNKFDKDFNNNYILELKNFLMYCDDKEKVKTSLDDGVKIMKLIIAAKSSSTSEKKVVLEN